MTNRVINSKMYFMEHITREEVKLLEYMGTKEAAEKWGYAQSTISKWCREGKIYLVVKPEKKGGQWQIPINAECPKKKKGRK